MTDEKIIPFKSQYGDRSTIGAIYQQAARENTEQFVTNGDLTNELMSSLVCDINDTIENNPHPGKDYYITVHEKKDLQMPRAILRRMITTSYRPYPEDDTLVFKVTQQGNDVRYCWCLPHWSEMENMLANENLFEKKLIDEIRAWKRLDLHHFGFRKNEIGNWEANPFWEDQKLGIQLQKFSMLVP